MISNGVLRSIRSVTETLLALAGATSLTLLLTVPFLPTASELDFRLRPVAQRSAHRLSWQALEQRIESLGLVEDVEVLLKRDGDHLVLLVPEHDSEVEQRVLQILEESGYALEPPSRRWRIHMESLKDPRLMAAQLSIQAVIFMAAGLLLTRWRVRRDAFAVRAGAFRATLLGLAAGTAALLASLLLSLGLEAAGLPVQEQEWVREILAHPDALARLVPWIVLVGPVAEEAFFRGYVFRFIRQHAGFPAGLVVSSAMFAAIHFNLSGFLIYLVIGCALAFVYEQTANLLAPIVAHVTLNSLVLLSSLMN